MHYEGQDKRLDEWVDDQNIKPREDHELAAEGEQGTRESPAVSVSNHDEGQAAQSAQGAQTEKSLGKRKRVEDEVSTLSPLFCGSYMSLESGIVEGRTGGHELGALF